MKRNNSYIRVVDEADLDDEYVDGAYPEEEEDGITYLLPQISVSDILKHGKYGIVKENRPEQIRMAVDIEWMLAKDESVLFAQGGCGIGKSFAYLIPALLQQGKRVVVATATTTLQDQLTTADLPHLTRKMGDHGKTWGVYKGRNNYLCRMLIEEAPTEDLRKQCKDFLKETGKRPADKKNWPGDEDPYWWGKVDASNCPIRKGCTHAEYCTTRPGNKDIVVANHALVGLDLARRHGSILKPYDVLIIDEGDEAADNFRDAFSVEVKLSQLQKMQNTFANDDELRYYINNTELLKLNACTVGIKDTLEAYADLGIAAQKAANAVSGTVRVKNLKPELTKLGDTAESLSSKLLIIDTHLEKKIQVFVDARTKKRLKALAEGRDAPKEVISETEKKLHKYKSRVQRMCGTLDRMSKFCAMVDISEPEDQLVTWQPLHILKILPVDIGAMLAEPMSHIKHKIITSATLAVAGDFSETRQELGLEHVSAKEEMYESPFDLDKQVLLYIPHHLPIPVWSGGDSTKRKHWIKEVTTELLQLLGATNGDAFVLFSSTKDMNDFIDEIGPDWWRNAGLNLCVQGKVARKTFDQFMAKPNSVIFGLKSFWKGINVPGDKLKMVVITKLPFRPINDALIIKLTEKAKAKLLKAGITDIGAFDVVQVPKMIKEVRQGVGRLIRQQTDVGIIAILDGKAQSSAINQHQHEAEIRRMLGNKSWVRTGYSKLLLDDLGLHKQTPFISVVENRVIRWFNITPIRVNRR